MRHGGLKLVLCVLLAMGGMIRVTGSDCTEHGVIAGWITAVHVCRVELIELMKLIELVKLVVAFVSTAVT